MKALTPEQLLAIADEFAQTTSAQVQSFSALVACAAVPGAKVHGVPVFDSVEDAARALAGGIEKLQPLSHGNEAFAQVAAEVYRRWAEV